MRYSKLAARKAQLLLVKPYQPEPTEPPLIDPRPEMVCFRGHTSALVRHFFELSCQVGRLPSLLGRELFASRVSHHAIPSFEEQIVFVRDVQLCLERLSSEHAEVITLAGLYDFSHEEVAKMLGCSRPWITQRLTEALDCLSELLLQRGLLSEQETDRRQRQGAACALPADVAAVGKKPPASVREAGRAEVKVSGRQVLRSAGATP